MDRCLCSTTTLSSLYRVARRFRKRGADKTESKQRSRPVTCDSRINIRDTRRTFTCMYKNFFTCLHALIKIVCYIEKRLNQAC